MSSEGNRILEFYWIRKGPIGLNVYKLNWVFEETSLEWTGYLWKWVK
jgi:hypothetical protein